jgi:septum formation protein
VHETPLVGELAQACAERLAREKALAVFGERPGDFVLGADTIVVVGNQILGKPGDADDAARMLRMLSGREHQVITGVCLAGGRAPQRLKPDGSEGANAGLKARSSTAPQASQVLSATSAGRTLHEVPEDMFVDVRSETTLVVMVSLTDGDIRSYIATGEPMDKAGAYAIQGIASRWISRIEGDYFNVVGLPVALVYEMLRERRVA